LTTDWSSTGVGAILSQQQGDTDRFIATYGRKCGKHETNYPSWKGEFLALTKGVEHFSHILQGQRFRVVTDSSALKQVQRLKSTSGLLIRWYGKLAGFDMFVEHRPGKDNVNADLLSRATHLPEPTEEEMAEEAEFIEEEPVITYKEDQPSEVNVVHKQLSTQDIQRAQEEDEILGEVREWVHRGAAPTRAELRGKHPHLMDYRQVFGLETFVIKQGVLYFTR
jgi:hypothetical protein